MSRAAAAPVVRRHGVAFLYALSVLMIVLSLASAFVEMTSSAAKGQYAVQAQRLAYEAALSGQAYATSYIQQLVDYRNNKLFLIPTGDMCGWSSAFAPPDPPPAGEFKYRAVERWAGIETEQDALGNPTTDWCPVNQVRRGYSANLPGGFGPEGIPVSPRALPARPAWFHYADIMVPGVNESRFRLWFRIHLQETLTRNGHFYANEDGTSTGDCTSNMAAPTYPFGKLQSNYGQFIGEMIIGPFTPCSQSASAPLPPSAREVPYPASNNILYNLVCIGAVQILSYDGTGTKRFLPVAYCRVDEAFQLRTISYVAPSETTLFVPSGATYRRLDERDLTTRLILSNPEATGTGSVFASPYLYFSEQCAEVVRDGPAALRQPNLADGRDGPNEPTGGGLILPNF